MVGSDKETSSHEEQKAGKPSFGRRVKHHYKRWWWVHVIVFIIVVLVVTLPIVYVAYPKIAQDGVNDSHLVLLSEKGLYPAPDSIDLELTTQFLTTSKYHPQLDAFNATLTLEGRDQPFASFEVPALKAENGTIAHVNQRINITNMEEFTEYNKAALLQEEYTVLLKGRGGLKQGGLPKTHVNYDQKVTTKGLNGLRDIQILSLTLLAHGPPDGTNTLGRASIYNPSLMTFDLGNVSMRMIGPGPAHLPIGDTLIVDAFLQPGNNTFDLRAVANQTSIVNTVLQKEYHCGVFPITITGNNVTVNGTILPYYTDALRSNTISTTLNLNKTIRDAGFGYVLGECS